MRVHLLRRRHLLVARRFTRRPTSAPRASTTVSSDAGKSKFDMTSTQERILEQYDVIVAGTGIAGVSAALAATELGMQVAVFEKDQLIGGGTCLSYGGIWAGCNHVAKAAGIPNSREATLEYMRFVAGNSADDELMQAFVDNAPIAIEFFDHCGVAFQITHGLADHYYPVAPGSTADGRSFEPVPISTRELGEWGSKIREFVHRAADFDCRGILQVGRRRQLSELGPFDCRRA